MYDYSIYVSIFNVVMFLYYPGNAMCRLVFRYLRQLFIKKENLLMFTILSWCKTLSLDG